MNKPERLDLETADITSENVAKIGALFPNCLTEAKDEKGRTVAAIDFDRLRQELSHDIVEGADERYRFDWPEKRKATILANTPTRMTLRPCREESVDFDTTQNIYIEGDNLEVLKLLRETYFGKVKMIYIDPPYNTGKDSFVYDDDFRKSADEFAEESVAVDEEGNRMFDLRQNNESNGRFHTDWLNMMYPRLKVAKDLLGNDGVIFISIDDNEVINLWRICDEIFGEKNFVGCISRATGTTTGQDAGKIGSSLDYCLVYAKSSSFILHGLPLSDADAKRFTEEDEKGRFSYLQLRKTGNADTREDRPKMFYAVKAPDGSDVYPFGPSNYLSRWRVGKETYEQLLKDNMIFWKKDDKKVCTVIDGFQQSKWTPYVKYYFEGRTKQISNLIENIEGNKKASITLKGLFGGKNIFDNPKPVEFINVLLTVTGEQDSIILDFFSGSATTAHAVMKLNAEDGGKRKFIMVQLPEPCDEKSEAAKAGYKNICEIGKERIRRAGKKILEEVAAKNAKAAKESAQGELALGDGHAGRVTLPDGGGLGEAALPDVGFRVLKLDTSNMEEVYYSPKAFADKVMQGTLNLDGDASLAENIKQGRTGEDLLFQSMLRLDVPLSAKIETEEIHGKRVFVVDDGYMMATFDKDVNEETIKAIAKRTPSIFVMCDGGFATDNVADNFEQIWKAFSPDTVRRVI